MATETQVLGSIESTAELNDAAAPTPAVGLEKKSDSLQDMVKEVSEIVLNKGDSKLLHLYRTNCAFRKSIRNATLLALFNSGYGFSLYRDYKCFSKLDKLLLFATTSGLIVDIAKIVSIWSKKSATPELGAEHPGLQLQ